jgi:Flp pilus assembly secretin CpaC
MPARKQRGFARANHEVFGGVQPREAPGPKVIVAASGEGVPGSVRRGPTTKETVAVTIDHAKVIRLPEGAQTIIIGNPIIADVTTQKKGFWC